MLFSCLRLAFLCCKGTVLYCIWHETNITLNWWKNKLGHASYCVMGRWFLTAVYLRIAFSCCKKTALFRTRR